MNFSWKGMLRSPAFNQQLVQSIFLGLLFLYFAVNFVVLGFLLGKFLTEKYPDENVFLMIGGGLLYYYLFDVIARIILQRYPVMEVKKYLHLNIPKSSIIHYLLVTSLNSFFNYLPLFALVPFIVINWSEMQLYHMGWPFIIIIAGMMLFNNYLSFGLDRYFRKNSIWPYMIIGILGTVLFLDINGYLSILPGLQAVFAFLSKNALYALLPALCAAAFYFWDYRTLKAHLYIEDIVPQKVSTATNLHIGFFDRFGQSGKLMNLEAKLIWRNKRSRMGLYMSLFFILYPLMFLGSDALRFDALKYFIGLFVTGVFAINYGQLMLSWNSTHFDLLATRNLKIYDIFKAKYYLMALSCVVLYLLSLVYGLVDLEWIKIFTLMFLFNMGVSIYLYMYLAAYNSKRIDPGKGAMMNYEGLSMSHFLIVFPLLALPALIKWPFSAAGYPYLGDFAIGFIGLLGIIFHKQLIRSALNLFLRNRYKIMAAFRTKS